MKIKGFLKECRERDVFKMLSIYIVSSWVLLQVLTVTQEPLGLPPKSLTYLIILLIILFPVYIFLIWRFGLAKNAKNQNLILKKDSKKLNAFRKIYFTGLSVVVFISAISVMLIVQNNFAEAKSKPIELVESDKIAVLRFGNNTGDKKYDIIGKMAADWIIHGITENQAAQVISPEIISEYSIATGFDKGKGDDQKMVEQYFKPGKIITGNYYLNGEELYFQCSLIEGNNKDIIMSFKDNECSLDMPLNCIEDLKQVILTYLTTMERPELELQEQPPKFEAYQNLLLAKNNTSDTNEYLELLNKAIEIDSNYFEPKVLRIAYYYNQSEYTKAESLLQEITPHTLNNSRQVNLSNMYKHLLDGNNKKVYTSLKKEYDFAPFDLQTNSSMMVIALQFVNRPEEVEPIFHAVDMTGMEVENCKTCRDRYYIMGLANAALGKYEEVISMLRPVITQVSDMYLKKPLLTAYIKTENTKALEKLLKNIALKNEHKDLLRAYLFVGREYLVKDQMDTANSYFQRCVLEAGEQEAYYKGLATYYLEEYNQAEKFLKEELVKDPEDLEVLGKLAVTKFKLGKTVQAEALITRLDTVDMQYKYGTPAYVKAQYYAATGQKTKCLNNLLKAVSEGYYFTSESYQNDPLLRSFFKTNAFKNILTYWY